MLISGKDLDHASPNDIMFTNLKATFDRMNDKVIPIHRKHCSSICQYIQKRCSENKQWESDNAAPHFRLDCDLQEMELACYAKSFGGCIVFLVFASTASYVSKWFEESCSGKF